jgi:signal transduction histidine kinase
MADIERAGLVTLTAVRRIVGLLRSDAPRPPAVTLDDLEQLVAELTLTHPTTVLDIDSATRAAGVPVDVASTLYRLLQEASTNVRRHGDPGSPVAFHLRRCGSAIEVVVENDTLGTPTGSGFGLPGMRERVEAVGGTFTAGSTSSGRWEVRASLPVAATPR